MERRSALPALNSNETQFPFFWTIYMTLKRFKNAFCVAP